MRTGGAWVEEQHAGVPLRRGRAVEGAGRFSLHPQGRPCGRLPPGSHTTATGKLASPRTAGGTSLSSAWLASPMGLDQQVDQWREFYLIYVLLLSLGMLVPTGRRPCPGSRSWSLPWSGSATRSPPGGECGGYVSRPRRSGTRRFPSCCRLAGFCCRWWPAWASSPAGHSVCTCRRGRGADRQRNSEHLGPAAVRSHPRTSMSAAPPPIGVVLGPV